MITESKRLSVGKLELAIWALCTFVALVIIFWVPKAIPVAPMVSVSYLFGYNNRAGVGLLLFFLGIGGYFSDRLGLQFPSTECARRVPKGAVWLWTAIFIVGAGAMYWFLHGFRGMGESMYFIDRLSLFMTGARPYRDFEFAYGPIFLEGPLLLTRLGLNVEQAYFLFLTLNYVASTWILAQVLNLIDYDSNTKPWLYHFLCLFAVSAFCGVGLQYTLLRFLLALYFALHVGRVDKKGGTRNHTIALLMIVAFTAVLILFSQEQALMFSVGTISYLVVLRWLDGSLLGVQQILSFVGLLAIEFALMIVAGHFDLFVSMKTFSSGAYNFPIIPAGHILLFFFCCGLAAVYVATRLREGSRGDSLLIVIAVSTCGLFATLGRCDPGHVVFDGIGIVIAATLLASNMPRVWYPYLAMFAVLFVVLPIASVLQLYRPFFREGIHLRARLSETRQSYGPLDWAFRRVMVLRPINIWETELSVPMSVVGVPALDLRAAYPKATGVLEAPFNFRPNGLGAYRSLNIDTGYFEGIDVALVPESIQRKISELEIHPSRALLLPAHFEGQCGLSPDGDKAAIRMLFWYPYRNQPRNFVNTVEPLCRYISAHYQMIQEPSPQGYLYGVWMRRK
jgi:hypothetical protein